MLCLMLQALEKPEVQAAFADCSKNPRNILKYQNDPDIVMVSSAPFLCGMHVYTCELSVYLCPAANLTCIQFLGWVLRHTTSPT